MKAQALIISSAILLGFSSSLLAQDASCDDNLNKLATDKSSPLEELSAQTRSNVEEHTRQALEAQSAGDEQGCILHSSMALEVIRKAGEAAPDTDETIQ